MQNKQEGNYVNQYLIDPVRKFFDAINLSSQLLLAATIIALIWANSAYANIYFDLWKTELSFVFGSFQLVDSLGHWINDGLMVIFFFVVGLEIKRELIVGELSSFKKASLPIIAAAGGMIVPALIYLGFNAGQAGMHGWGIPMATDIAFAVGCLMVLGKRVPLALKIFLLSVAVVDDIGAILVIAIFYTDQVSINSLLLAGGILCVSALLNYLGVRKTYPYAILGIVLWLAFLQSGVHATLAGVLLAFTIPARAIYNNTKFKQKAKDILIEIPDSEFSVMCIDESKKIALNKLKKYVDDIGTPLQRIEDALHPIAVYIVIPIFALANAGVSFVGGEKIELINPVTLGVVLGLILGKQIGITFFSWVAVKMGIAFLPEGVNWKQIYAISCLAGIGFTMSLFITNLAFTDIVLMEQAKVGILAGSLVSAVIGLTILRLILGDKNKEDKEEKLKASS